MEGQAGLRARRLDPLQQLGGFLGRQPYLLDISSSAPPSCATSRTKMRSFFGVAGFGQQLVQLGVAVHHIIGDAMFLERGLGLAGQAHRRHEMADGVGKQTLTISISPSEAVSKWRMPAVHRLLDGMTGWGLAFTA